MAWKCTAQNERIKENLIARIIREDKRQTQAEEEVSTLALQVKSLHVRPNGSHSKMDSNGERNYKKKSNSKKLEELKKKTLCAYCHEKSHWYRECKKRIAEEGRHKKRRDDAQGTAYMCDIAGFVSETTDNDESVWLADSGASMHMSSRRDFFQQIQPVKSVQFVKVAGERMLKVAGVETIDIDAVLNSKHVGRKLEKVLYVPDLKKSLFSVGAIADKGFMFHIYNDRCEVRERNGTLSAEGVRYGQLFRMRFNAKIPTQCNVAHENTLKL
ncbi:hypothetical protein KM043_013242 [Ampulex compressa]|nr:hypothetical protein KM043_013242 [Ampulex compressa]